MDPAGWDAGQLAASSDWTYQLDAPAINDLRSMVTKVRRLIGDDPNGLLSLSASDFDLGSVAPLMRSIDHDLRDGWGFALVPGVPLDELSLLDTAVIYWGMGAHLRTAKSNNPQGDVFGHVTDLGKTNSHPLHRGYQTSQTLDYHTDQVPVVALLCMQTARRGGLSNIASSTSAYNEVLRRRPDLLEPLTQPFCWSMMGEIDPGAKPYSESPVFNFIDGYLSTSFGNRHVFKGHELSGTPELTDIQREALDYLDELCGELHFAMELLRGDIQFVNNIVVMHTRNAFEDWPEPERKTASVAAMVEYPEQSSIDSTARALSRGPDVERHHAEHQFDSVFLTSPGCKASLPAAIEFASLSERLHDVANDQVQLPRVRCQRIQDQVLETGLLQAGDRLLDVVDRAGQIRRLEVGRGAIGSHDRHEVGHLFNESGRCIGAIDHVEELGSAKGERGRVAVVVQQMCPDRVPIVADVLGIASRRAGHPSIGAQNPVEDAFGDIRLVRCVGSVGERAAGDPQDGWIGNAGIDGEVLHPPVGAFERDVLLREKPHDQVQRLIGAPPPSPALAPALIRIPRGPIRRRFRIEIGHQRAYAARRSLWRGRRDVATAAPAQPCRGQHVR